VRRATEPNQNTNNLMKKTATILAALALGVATASAGVAPAPTGKMPPPPPMDPCAGPISYNNIELLYASTDIDVADDSADGGVLRLEYSPMANLYLAGSVEYVDFDYGNLWMFTAGVGGYFPLTENIHLAADAGWLYIRAESDSESSMGDDSESESGWYVRPHLRAKWGCFTAHAGALYRDLGDDWSSESSDWSWFINLYYQLNANWDLTVGYMDGDEFETITAGVRFRY
jgi:hypothetical protein